MLDLSEISQAQGLWPLLVLVASLIGSWHCVGMCGPLACSPALHGKTTLYHFGRMLSYSFLGFLAGFFGQQILTSDFFWLRMLSGILLASMLLALGFSHFFRLQPPVIHWFKFLSPILRKVRGQAFLIGLLSGLLPCGWLYSFVLVSATTQSAALGTLVMFIFWVGTVPALTGLSAGISRLILGQKLTHERLVGGFFIFAGLYSLFAHFYRF